MGELVEKTSSKDLHPTEADNLRSVDQVENDSDNSRVWTD